MNGENVFFIFFIYENFKLVFGLVEVGQFFLKYGMGCCGDYWGYIC